MGAGSRPGGVAAFFAAYCHVAGVARRRTDATARARRAGLVAKAASAIAPKTHRSGLLDEVRRVVHDLLPGQGLQGGDAKEEPERPAGERHGGESRGGHLGPQGADGGREGDEAEAERRGQPEGGPQEKARAAEGEKAQRLAGHGGEVEGRENDADGLASLAQREAGGGEGTRQRRDEEGRTGGASAQEPGDAEPEQQVRAQEHLEEGHGARLERSEGQVPAGARLLEAGERDEGAHREAEGGHDRVGVDEGEEEVPAQEVGPPVGLWIRGEDEREVGQEERPRDEGHGERGSAEAGGEGAQGQDEGHGPEGDVEAGQRVPGIRARPPARGGADEVRTEVVAEGEASDTGYLGRVADRELVRETHVEGGVEGHERVEQEVRALFAGARVARLDRDTARHRTAPAAMLGRFARGEIDVLVGTQMIAKGHDFPRVTLVGVVSADVGLGLADFRAAERTFQLLTQVVGRAGRGEQPGEAVIQTLFPDHYSIQHACRQDYASFYADEARFRRAMRYPPVVGLINVVVRGRTLGTAMEVAADLARRTHDRLPRHEDFEVLGPAPAPFTKLRGECRAQFFLKGPRRLQLRAALDEALADRPDARRKIAIDVDPMSVL